MLIIIYNYSPKTLTEDKMAEPVKLSPPEYTLWNKYKAVFGVDPQVTVKDLVQTTPSEFMIPIIVDHKAKGDALRTIILPEITLGTFQIQISVTNSTGVSWAAITIKDAQNLADTTTAAMKGNPLFVEAKVIPSKVPGPQHPCMGFIMTRSVIQFSNDDISDVFNNFNGVTANVLHELIILHYEESDVTVIKGTTPTWLSVNKQFELYKRMTWCKTDKRDCVYYYDYPMSYYSITLDFVLNEKVMHSACTCTAIPQ